MQPNDAVFQRAVPHEAGHVLVAYSFAIPVRQIAYYVRSERDARIVSLIAEPPRVVNEEQKRAHCVVASAGMAGEVVATGAYDRANLAPLNPDIVFIRRLAGVGAGLTDFVQQAKRIIGKNRRTFDRLCSALRERYPDVRRQIVSNGKPAIYPLLIKEDLDKILADISLTGDTKPSIKRSSARRSREIATPRKRPKARPTPRKRSDADA